MSIARTLRGSKKESAPEKPVKGHWKPFSHPFSPSNVTACVDTLYPPGSQLLEEVDTFDLD